MNQTTAIAPADLLVVQGARSRAELAGKDLELVNLKLFLRYGLVEGDSYDMATGKITRAEAPAPPAAAAVAPGPARPANETPAARTKRLLGRVDAVRWENARDSVREALRTLEEGGPSAPPEEAPSES